MDRQPKRRVCGFGIRCSLVFFISLAFGCCGFSAVRATIFVSRVSGSSMEPSLHDGEYTVGIRPGWPGLEICRGDIICFNPSAEPDVLYVKRVIGLPGDTVTLKEGRVYINGSGQPINEPYLKETWTVNNGPMYFEVPDGCYLVMGDNRNVSYDSRSWADPYVDYGSIRSKVCFAHKPLFRF